MNPGSVRSPADPETCALVRAHVLATLVAGVVASALGALTYLQLVSPGTLGGAAWLGIGRLRFACFLVVLFGWLGNMLAISVYLAFPWVAERVVRLRVGAVKFAAWNFVIAAPVVVMALSGILPPTRVLAAWFALSSWPQPTMVVTAIFVAASMLVTARLRLGIPSRPFDLSFAMIVFGAAGLMIGGIGGELAQAAALRGGAPWLDGVAAMRAYWITSGLSWLVVLAGCVLGCVAVSRPADGVRIPTSRASRWALGLWMVATVCWPVAVYFTETLDASSMPTTASEARGRATFVREGCATCHATGDRRGIGPDLSRESGVRPADWQFAHLFSPRAVVPRSVMPSYARLFDGAPGQPTQEGRDLVAYLDSLGRAWALGAPDADAAGVHPAAMNPARARRSGAVPPLSAGDCAAGMTLFADHCAGCHGPNGEGDGPGAAGLRPKPANLAAHRYADAQIATVLWNGVAGTAMPAWRDRPLSQIAMLIAAAKSFGDDAATRRPEGADTPPADALAAGARVYAANCSQCHGEHGGGDGFSAASLSVAPANFQRQQPSLDYALRVIAGGVEGTPMAPWTSRMSEQDVLAVAHYVRSLYQGGAR